MMTDDFFREEEKNPVVELSIQDQLAAEQLRQLKEPKKRDPWTRHPMAIAVMVFVLTGGVGQYLNADYQRRTQDRERREAMREAQLKALTDAVDSAEASIRTYSHGAGIVHRLLTGSKEIPSADEMSADLIAMRRHRDVASDLCRAGDLGLAERYQKVLLGFAMIDLLADRRKKMGWPDTITYAATDSLAAEFSIYADSSIDRASDPRSNFEIEYEPRRARQCRKFRVDGY